MLAKKGSQNQKTLSSQKVFRTYPQTRRGFTIMELMVTMTLVTMLGLMTAYTMDSLFSSTASTVNRSQSRQEARDILSQASRDLKSARPLGACFDSGTAVFKSAVTCNRIGETGAAFMSADAFSMTFYSYATQADPASPPTTGPPPLSLPQLVTFGRDSDTDQFVLKRRDPTSGTYTNVMFDEDSNPVFGKTVSGLSNTSAQPLFVYYDASGQEIDVADLAPTASPNRLEDIALVKVAPKISYKDRARSPDSPLVFEDELVLSLSGTSFNREASWFGN